MDALACAESEAAADDAHLLRLAADEVHFDAVALAVIDGAMAEGGEVEIAADLVVDADQHIEIEARRDACSIVIGGVQNAFVLFEVNADDHLRAVTQDVPRG